MCNAYNIEKKKKATTRCAHKYNIGITEMYYIWGELMGNREWKEEKNIDIEDLLKESLSDTKLTKENQDFVLENLCKAITLNDSQEELKQKVNNGDAHADIQLASWYIANAKNIKDYCIAHKHASKAAKKGDVEAYYILGQLYMYGVGCTKNMYKAIRYLRYFVNHIIKKELLNEDVLIDAYTKLAEAEKSRGHYLKAYLCYQELQKYDSHYDIYANEMMSEMKNRKREFIFQTIFFVCGFVFLCGIVCFMARFLAKEAQVLKAYPLKKAVIFIEEDEKDMPLEPDVAVREDIKEEMVFQAPVLYRIVEEDEFLKLDLSEIKIAGVTATSEYISTRGNNFGPTNLVDHDSDTTWQEGEKDAGIGQQLTFRFVDSAIVSAIRLENGKRTSKKEFYENNRIASFQISDENMLLIEIPDSEEVQYIIFENPNMKNQITLILDSVFVGTKWNDTCVTEIAFYE